MGESMGSGDVNESSSEGDEKFLVCVWLWAPRVLEGDGLFWVVRLV